MEQILIEKAYPTMKQLLIKRAKGAIQKWSLSLPKHNLKDKTAGA
jgi:hypothetical protein